MIQVILQAAFAGLVFIVALLVGFFFIWLGVAGIEARKFREEPHAVPILCNGRPGLTLAICLFELAAGCGLLFTSLWAMMKLLGIC